MRVQLLSIFLLAGLLMVLAKPSTTTEESVTQVKSHLTTKRVFRTVRAKNSQSTIKPTSGKSSVQKQVNVAVLKLKTDLTEMKDEKKYDDKVLISDATVLNKLVLGNLKGEPEAVQPQLSSLLTEIQRKIDKMTTSGKFDQSVVGDFNSIGKILNNAVKTTKASKQLKT